MPDITKENMSGTTPHNNREAGPQAKENIRPDRICATADYITWVGNGMPKRQKLPTRLLPHKRTLFHISGGIQRCCCQKSHLSPASTSRSALALLPMSSLTSPLFTPKSAWPRSHPRRRRAALGLILVAVYEQLKLIPEKPGAAAKLLVIDPVG